MIASSSRLRGATAVAPIAREIGSPGRSARRALRRATAPCFVRPANAQRLAANALEGLEGEGGRVALVGRVALLAGERPFGGVPRGEERIAFRGRVDAGDEQPVGERQGLAVDLRPAGDEGLVVARAPGELERRLERGGETDPLGELSRETTTVMRPGSGLPIDSQVRRPMIRW
jgi:hypothetical protein